LKSFEMTDSDQRFPARLHAITYGCEDVLLFDLRSADSRPLPPFDPGSHVDLRLPNGLVRSYSLMNDCAERHRYVLGIKREPASRGGSNWLHDQARVGMSFEVTGPCNHFALQETAAHSVLIAGGIGITPIWSMVQRMQALGRPWQLHYRARRRACAPLLEELSAPSLRPHVSMSFSDEDGVPRLEMERIVRGAPEGSHYYCCGPLGMIEAFQAASADIDAGRVHFEYFAPKETAATDGGFTLKLARSGREIAVRPGQTILATLQGCGVSVPASCEQGVCGTCEVGVISGTPDHRDIVLSDVEKQSGKTMMICCSGSLGPTLVLDL